MGIADKSTHPGRAAGVLVEHELVNLVPRLVHSGGARGDLSPIHVRTKKNVRSAVDS